MDLYDILVAKALSGSGGGGGEPVIEALSVTENGTYTAPSGVDGYSPVAVNVSGGGSSYTLLHESEYELSLPTGSQLLGTFDIPGIYTSGKLIYICARRKEGKPSAGYYGCDIFISNNYETWSSPANYPTHIGYSYMVPPSGSWSETVIRSGSTGGIYPTEITTNDTITMYAAYNSNRSGVIDGTYVVQIYALEWPGNVSPFVAE